MITGASAGIGEAMARVLAAEGVHLVLVARRGDRLEALRAELASATVEVEVLAADLATDAGVAAVAARLAAPDPPVDLLVNNAGFGSHGRLWERPLADARGQIAVNVQALVALSHAAASAMVPRAGAPSSTCPRSRACSRAPATPSTRPPRRS